MKATKGRTSSLQATHPMKLVHTGSGKTDKDINVLVVTDNFSCYAQEYITPSQTARVVASTLWDQFFAHYGLPEQILSDQGYNFESKLIAELCELSKIKKLRTSPYGPQTNGHCKAF